MTSTNIEEKSPLLFVLDGNEDISKAERAHFDTNRFKGITHGAAVVFTHFPNFIGTYWIATALCGLTFFMLVLLLLSSIAAAGLRLPRCVASEEPSNATIHLVHLHRPGEWNRKEAKLLEQILQKYPSHQVHLIAVGDDRGFSASTSASAGASTVSPRSSRALPTLVRRKRTIEFDPFNINLEAKRLIDMLLRGKLDEKLESKRARSVSTAPTTKPSTAAAATTPAARTLEELASKHRNIQVERLTFQQAFASTPLHRHWPHLNSQLRVFAVRVLQLWQHGGLSFDLQAPREALSGVGRFVLSEKLGEEEVPTGVVRVDLEGWYLESRVPCHAFFGEVVVNLRKAEGMTAVRDVMRKTVKVFCKYFSSASKTYCEAFNKH